ncbi:Uncharacterised protein [Raoultella ornithinolytica]|jgi:drug/metabolite transporter (DMT)-like permease|nr:hypothetical protein HY59_20910 [Raoultella ornithinolytica]PQH21383.1 hypothetical protein CWD63_21595 [Raoultella ornithinolytica]RWS95399.1 hypothetical protein DN592_28855 [Raoultella ornithinolytica]SBM05576.1 Uncharacterised protein [Raoultella ornithinolytica]HBP36088.1 hypothetical protein [Raoultella ornithinolytica]
MRKMKLLMYWFLFFIVFYGCIYIGVYVCGEVFKPSRIAMLAFIFSSLFTVLLLRKRVRLDM